MPSGGACPTATVCCGVISHVLPMLGKLRGEMPVARAAGCSFAAGTPVVMADGKVQGIVCTPEHPFFVDGKGWVEAGSLGIGTSIVTRAGPVLAVKSLDWKRSTQHAGAGTPAFTVYNFTVDASHTFFVGSVNGGVWTHNSGCNLSYLSGKTFPHSLGEMDNMMVTQGEKTAGGHPGSYGMKWPYNGGTLTGGVHGPAYEGQMEVGHNTLHYHIEDASGNRLPPGRFLPGETIP